MNDNHKNIMFMSLLCVGVFLLTSISFLFYLVPHYDESGNYKLIGRYYNTEHISKLDKSNQNNKKLKKMIENYKTKNNSLSKKIKNFSEKYKNIQKNNQKNIDKLQSQNNSLQSNIGVLRSQLSQQQEFIKNQNIEHKQENKQKEFIKKRQFSNVSKNNITNERPQLGNMYSKSLKKTTTTST